MARVEPGVLRRVLEKHFDREELEQLAADVQESVARTGSRERVSLEAAGGDSYPNQILKFVRFLERRELLDALVTEINRERPGAIAAAATSDAAVSTDNNRLIMLMLVVTMCLFVLLVGAAVCALVWARVAPPVFLYLTVVLLLVPASLAWKWLAQRRSFA